MYFETRSSLAQIKPDAIPRTSGPEKQKQKQNKTKQNEQKIGCSKPLPGN